MYRGWSRAKKRPRTEGTRRDRAREGKKQREKVVGDVSARTKREFGANGVEGSSCSVPSGTSSNGNALINPLEGECIGGTGEIGRRGFGYNRRLLRRRRRGGGHGRARDREESGQGGRVRAKEGGRQAAPFLAGPVGG